MYGDPLKTLRIRGVVPRDHYIDGYGYRALTDQIGHPLANKKGQCLEHRKVLYDKIGPGPHSCFWIDVFQCGNNQLDWGRIAVDHLDNNRLNNQPDNLVPSCRGCNSRRPTIEQMKRMMLLLDEVMVNG